MTIDYQKYISSADALRLKNKKEIKIKTIILPHTEANIMADVDNGSRSTNRAQILKTINSIKKQRK